MHAITPPDAPSPWTRRACAGPEPPSAVRGGGALVGCGAVKRLDAGHAELKSMRTSPAQWRRVRMEFSESLPALRCPRATPMIHGYLGLECLRELGGDPRGFGDAEVNVDFLGLSEMRDAGGGVAEVEGGPTNSFERTAFLKSVVDGTSGRKCGVV